jgi:hypothetical protein
MFVSAVLGPHSLKGGCGGDSPPITVSMGFQGGGDKFFCIPPLVGNSGATPRKRNFGKKCLVKYCNFIVNLDRSL